MPAKQNREYYLRDILIFLVSIAIAVLLQRTGILREFIEWTSRVPYLAPFAVGAFFTSLFTFIPATAAITELARAGTSILPLALIGGLGAMVADYLLYILLREAVAEPVLLLIHTGSSDRLQQFVQSGKHRLVGTLLGAIIIASPFPDEIGLLLMGLSKARWYTTILVTYILNVAGIGIVALAANAL